MAPMARKRRGSSSAGAASPALSQALASASQAVGPTSAAGRKKQKPRGPKRPNVWESDAARPGGPSSMDVLVAWLSAEGNYARWVDRQAPAASEPGGARAPGKRGGGTRASLIREVLAAFEAEGLHRTMQDVRNRVAKLEREFAAARAWLRDTGFLLAFERGAADKDVERSVLRLCKHYRALAPRFLAAQPHETIDLGNSTDENEEEEEERAEAREEAGGASPAIDSDAGAEQGEEEKEGQRVVAEEDSGEELELEAAAEVEERSDASSGAGDEQEEQEEEGGASGADNHEEDEEDDEEEEQRAQSGESEEEEQKATSPTAKRRRLADEYESDSSGSASDGETAHRHRSALLAAAEEQREQRRALFELERAKLERELELKEVQVAFEKSLARQKLLGAGVPQDEIDRVLPL